MDFQYKLADKKFSDSNQFIDVGPKHVFFTARLINCEIAAKTEKTVKINKIFELDKKISQARFNRNKSKWYAVVLAAITAQIKLFVARIKYLLVKEIHSLRQEWEFCGSKEKNA